MPGDNMTIKIRTSVLMCVQEGLRFALRESGKTVGHGIITKKLADDAIPADIGRKARAERAEREQAENQVPPTNDAPPKK